jgi:hypothetical protein
VTVEPGVEMAIDCFVCKGAGCQLCSNSGWIEILGAGMIHPDMATLPCFLATDAAVSPAFLKKALRNAVDASFNMITVDGDTSPNDSAIILANGLAGNKVIKNGTPAAEEFQKALSEVCLYLAKSIAKDGEGATKLIQITVEGSLNIEQAQVAARTIAGSSLVKSAIHGSDPNWGRIIAALGPVYFVVILVVVVASGITSCLLASTTTPLTSITVGFSLKLTVVVRSMPPMADWTTSCISSTLRPYRAAASRLMVKSMKYPVVARSA